MELQCLYYALDMWNERGGYLMFGKSTHWCMPHVLHFDKKTSRLTHYVPPENLKYPWYSMFGFEGYIKTVDLDDREPMPALCMFFGTLALILFGFLWSVQRATIRRNRRKVERRAHPRSSRSPPRRRLD